MGAMRSGRAVLRWLTAACFVRGSAVAAAAAMNYGGLTTAPTAPERWQLAMNVDTSDGHVVDFANLGFWQSATEVGGASTVASTALTMDFKDLTVFASTIASELLVVVHEEGVAKGWRTWDLARDDKPLQHYFGGTGGSGAAIVNVCATTSAFVDHSACNQISKSTPTGENVGSLNADEPLIKRGGLLYTNAGTGNVDFNRLTTLCAGSDNIGYGLGTNYDAVCDSAGACGHGPDCGQWKSNRPQADAWMYKAPAAHFAGGMIGSDNSCYGGCAYSTTSGFNYDYAIYVKGYAPTLSPTAEPTVGLTPAPSMEKVPFTQASRSSVHTPELRTDVVHAAAVYINGQEVPGNIMQLMSSMQVGLDSCQSSLAALEATVGESRRSTYFGGSGNYLTTPDSELFNFKSGDFTVEAWYKSGSSSGCSNNILSQSNGGAASDSALYFGAATDFCGCVSDGSGWDFCVTSGGPAIPANQWTHAAFVRAGDTLTAFVNGAPWGAPVGLPPGFALGNSGRRVMVANQEQGSAFTGFLSNVRVVKGRALYAATFVPSTTLSAVPGTSLLALKTDSTSDHSGHNLVLTTVGTPTLSTDVN